jgi:uncharacterized pyridoxamine 5'-phosphate oxidase family protein/Pyruvate/2-oxoacid:ferredoxin oxidoreductase delta subunit
MKNLTESLNTLREIKDIAFATVDAGGNPQVRIVDVMMVSEDALYFCTARGKDFYLELISSGKVAAVAMTENWEMIRLSGRAVRLDEQKKWIDRIFDNNPAMLDVYPGDTRYILEAFCIRSGSIEVFDLSSHPICRRTYSLGGGEIKDKGFVVNSNDCISCGICAEKCPQSSIIMKEKAFIVQEHCLHCGLCSEVCPSEAIKRR